MSTRITWRASVYMNSKKQKPGEQIRIYFHTQILSISLSSFISAVVGSTSIDDVRYFAEVRWKVGTRLIRTSYPVVASVEYISFVFPTEVFLLSSCRCRTFPEDHKSGFSPRLWFTLVVRPKKVSEARQNRHYLLHCTHKMALIAFYVHFLQRILWTSKAV